MEQSDSSCIGKEPCPKCGSRDNLARYSDGHAYCFSTGCDHYEPATGEADFIPAAPRERTSDDFVVGEFAPLSSRKLSAETCRKFGYRIGMFNKQHVQAADYLTPDGTRVVGQKLRFADKKFTILGSLKEAGLFGQHLWRERGKMVVVTEGEIDALTVSQLQANKWPVVSIPNGAQGAKKALAAQLEWLLGFETVVLMFDDDEPGHIATAECARLFPPGRCKIARIEGHKDANAALQAGEGGKVIEAIWGAREYRPDGIVTLTEVADRAAAPTARGIPWFHPELDKLTLGRRMGELILVGGGSGLGKTHFGYMQMDCDLRNGYPVAAHLMEAQPEQTVRALAGIRAAVNYTEVSDDVDPAILREHIRAIESGPAVYILDSQGANDWDSIAVRIRHLTHANGVRLHYVDNLTTLAAGSDLDEKEAVEKIVSEAAGMVVELGINIVMFSHLATPEGKGHEEGARVMLKHFRGSRAVGYWSWIVIGLERNAQAEDPGERSLTCLRLLKCRPKGSSTGSTCYSRYDSATSLIQPVAAPVKGSSHGFKDESGNTDF